MATKKKAKKKNIRAKARSTRARAKAKPAKKKAIAAKTRRKVATRKRTVKTAKPQTRRAEEKELRRDSSFPEPRIARRRSGDQGGDLQGVSRAERSDSESVDELVEEGNIFEASAVSGVERAEDNEEREVRTEQFPEDDVPEEYLDKD